jgi:hypothetical protein
MDGEPGIPLGDYLKHNPRAGVAIWCNGCQRVEKHDMAAVIARLDARGLDGRRVGIRTLARMVARPCPQCGGTDFESRPDHPAPAMGFSR